MNARLKKFTSSQLSTLNLIVGDMIVKHQFKEGGKCIKLMQDLLDNINETNKIKRGGYETNS